MYEKPCSLTTGRTPAATWNITDNFGDTFVHVKAIDAARFSLKQHYWTHPLNFHLQGDTNYRNISSYPRQVVTYRHHAHNQEYVWITMINLASWRRTCSQCLNPRGGGLIYCCNATSACCVIRLGVGNSMHVTVRVGCCAFELLLLDALGIDAKPHPPVSVLHKPEWPGSTSLTYLCMHGPYVLTTAAMHVSRQSYDKTS